MSIRLGAISGVLQHGLGVLRALRIGSTISICEETLEAVARDPQRMRDLHHHATALDGYLKELVGAGIPIKKE